MEFRLANKQDLPKLKTMFLEIADNMNKNGIGIWNEYYPYEEFEQDIKDKCLWLLAKGDEILSAIGLFKSLPSTECFSWKDDGNKAMYISRLGINIAHLRQGYAKCVLDFVKQRAAQSGAKSLRLLVAEINKPALSLYTKYGFKQVEGIREEYSPSLNITIKELGFEYII